MSDHVMRLLFSICVALSAGGCAAFTVLYHKWYPWWRSEAGQNLFFFSAVLGIVDAIWFAALTAGPLWATHLRYPLIAAYALQPFVVWWRVSLLVRVKRRDDATPVE